MSNAFLGKGTQMQRESAPASGTYVTIAEALSISGPTQQAEEVDVTNMDSTGDFREYIRGLIDAGEITFEVNYNPNEATHQQLETDLAAGTKSNYRIRYPQLPTVWTFTFEAFVKGLPKTIPVDSQVRENVTLRITGAITAASE